MVVERAMNVFWSHGYGGTSLPQLLKATKLSRGSLYSAFGDKHGLFLQALDRYVADALVRIDEELSPSRSPFDGLRAFLIGYVARMSGAAGVRGCLVVATAMELAGHDEAVAKRIKHFFDGAETRLRKALVRAEAEGELAPGVEPEHVARVLLGLVEGIRVLAKTGVDCVAWQRSVDALIDGFERRR